MMPASSAPPSDSRLTDAGLGPGPDGALAMNGIPLASIAEQVGTPAFVYDAATIRRRYAGLDAAFGALPHRICYAVKANSNLAILRTLARLGAGADIVSGGEMLRALAAGFAPSSIVFSGVGKTDDELLAAIMAGVGHINVESLAELRRIATLTDLHDQAVTLGIRINPDVTADTHPYISTGKGGLKFGVPRDQFAEALQIIDEVPRLRLGCIAMQLRVAAAAIGAVCRGDRTVAGVAGGRARGGACARRARSRRRTRHPLPRRDAARARRMDCAAA